MFGKLISWNVFNSNEKKKKETLQWIKCQVVIHYLKK